MLIGVDPGLILKFYQFVVSLYLIFFSNNFSTYTIVFCIPLFAYSTVIY